MIEKRVLKFTPFKSIILGSFFRSVSMLVGGTAFAQLLAIVATPILTRLYTPDEFGVLGVYSAFLTILIVVASLRYEVAIPLPRSNCLAVNVLGVSLICVTGITIFISFAVLLWKDYLAQLTKTPQLESYLWLLPIGVALGGVYGVFQFWAIRQKAFSRIARTRIAQSLFGTGTQVLIGFGMGGAIGLILGQVINQVVGIFELIRRALQDDSTTFRKINARRMRCAAVKYDRFPKFSSIEALTNAGGVHFPVLVIASFLGGSKDVGFLMVAMRIMQAPLGVMGSAISQVYYSNAVDEKRKGTLGGFTERTVVGLAKIGIGPLVFAGIVAPLVVPIIFGEAWVRVGYLIRWMVPWFVFQYLSAPVAMAMHVTSSQRAAMHLQIFGLVFRVLSIFICYKLGFINFIVECYVLSGFVFYSICLLVILRVAGVDITKILKSVIKVIPIVGIWSLLGVVVSQII